MDGRLKIITGYKQGRSYTKDVFVSPPFRVIPVGQTKNGPSLYLMITSTSPGILSGDRYELGIQVGESTRLQLQSQSYQRLFDMEQEATQTMQIDLAKDSVFSYIPHPLVPHKNSKFKGINRVNLADGCEFLMSEIITCGRKLMGEVFEFSYLQNLMEVRHGGKLILKDNLWLNPAQVPIQALGQLEEYTHQASLVYLNTRHSDTGALIEQIHQLLQAETTMAFGISATESDGFVLRCLGNGAEQLYTCFLKIQDLIWNET